MLVVECVLLFVDCDRGLLSLNMALYIAPSVVCVCVQWHVDRIGSTQWNAAGRSDSRCFCFFVSCLCSVLVSLVLVCSLCVRIFLALSPVTSMHYVAN